MRQKNWIYIFITGFGLGILFRSFFNFGLSFSIFIVFLFLATVLSYFVLEKNRKIAIASFFILGLSLGILRFDIADFKHGNFVIENILEQRISAEGIVIDEPDERENHTKLTVLLGIVSGEKVKSKVLITTDSHPQFSYGDRISVEGKISKPEKFAGDDEKIFDYPAFLSKDKIFYLMFYPEIEFVSENGGNPIKRVLFSFKNKFLESVGKVIPEPQSSLLGGLVVGAKQSLGEKLQDDFRKTGIIHIVVLSGYNVTIVAEAIMRFFSFLPNAAGMALGIVSIIFFAIMTGASATIVRASIMALLVILARATGRSYAITYALFLAGFFMVLHNPKILVFDSSFQLSFMATLGLINLAPIIERYFKLVPTKWQLREFATATVATQLFVLPLLLYKMGELSIVALPVNILILAFVPLTMLFGFLTGVIGFVSTFLSLPFAYITNVLLSYELLVVKIFSSLPFSSVRVETFPAWAAVLLYILYGFFIWKFYNSKN